MRRYKTNILEDKSLGMIVQVCNQKGMMIGSLAPLIISKFPWAVKPLFTHAVEAEEGRLGGSVCVAEDKKKKISLFGGSKSSNSPLICGVFALDQDGEFSPELFRQAMVELHQRSFDTGIPVKGKIGFPFKLSLKIETKDWKACEKEIETLFSGRYKICLRQKGPGGNSPLSHK